MRNLLVDVSFFLLHEKEFKKWGIPDELEYLTPI